MIRSFSRMLPNQAFVERSPSSLLSFYEDSAEDNRGRRLEDILQWPATQLEYCHDYIQVLFPLPERSIFNDPAPIVDKEVFDAFRTRKELRDRLRDSFKRILWFYGFQLHMRDGGELEVRPGPTFLKHGQHWDTGFNHNHLRITRIIRSLRVLGLEEESVAFYNAIARKGSVSLRSRMYWRRAATRPLNIAPHVDDEDIDDQCIGPKFLREFEKDRKAGVNGVKEVQTHTSSEDREEATGSDTL